MTSSSHQCVRNVHINWTRGVGKCDQYLIVMPDAQ